ncbi:MAG TPA: hypothetical protein PK323_15005 [Bacteroidia bacterium]|nr:hypothetical protein [Bacteroidia bacterium]
MSQQQSFTDFKLDFYNKVKDFGIFDCAEFNALKIVLDGLRVNYVSRGPVDTPIFNSLKKYDIENILRRLKAKISRKKKYSRLDIEGFKNKKYLISDDGRLVIDANDKPHSYYFYTLMQTLNPKDCLHIIDKQRNANASFDLHYELLVNTFSLLSLNQDEVKLIKEIRITYERIKKSSLFGEKDLKNIAFAFQNFFNKYKVWSRLLDEINPSTMFCIVHYHNEGKALAFKRKGIKMIELQHGLIARKDVFYVFPEQTKSVIHKSLFADEIWVYGNYWKKVLEFGVEYVNKIKIAGYYLFDNFEGYDVAEKEIDDFAEGKKIIFITTQTTLHKAFIEYTLWLINDIKQRNLPYKILVKTHPLEKKEHYAILNQTDGVKMVNYPLPVIFKKVALQVSIYSTTLYDGARASVPGFALFNHQYQDYIDEIVQSGVAFPLAQNENPVDKLNQIKEVDPSYYYSEFQFPGI